MYVVRRAGPADAARCRLIAAGLADHFSNEDCDQIVADLIGHVATLIDTNLLVYRYDERFPDKQRIAGELLRAGIADGSVFIAHQAIVEFVAAVTRATRSAAPILEPDEARREAEEMLAQFEVLYPDEDLVRTALRGAAAYQLSWFDAHMWAFAERYGVSELASEDFQHGRLYGTVRAVNPFLG